VDFKKVIFENVDWVHLAQDKVLELPLVKKAMSL
jgi:hypothetical protein